MEATKYELQQTKEILLKFQIRFNKRMDSMILWIVGTQIGVVILIFLIIKLFITK